MQADSKLLKRPEAAETLQITVRTLDSLVKRRLIAHVKIGKSVRFTPSAIAEYIAASSVPAITIH